MSERFPELSPEVWDLLEERVVAFEAAWLAGRRPEIRAYLLDPDPTGGQLLVELAQADVEFRIAAGETPQAAEYVAAFPALGRPDLVRDLESAASRIKAARPGGRTIDRTRLGRETDVAAFELQSAVAGGHGGRGMPPGSLADACAEFEREWRSGSRPRIEDFLVDTAQDVRTTLFSRLLDLEVRLRKERGEEPRPDEYVSRFPEFSDRLSATHWADRLEETASHGSLEGTRFAHFELQQELGSGGFGTVWKAIDLKLGRTVAVKILHPYRAGGEGAAMFLREAQAAARLRHPNLVAVHEARFERGLAYIVYDFVDGVTLRQWLTGPRPSPRKAAEMCRVLARAVG